MSNSIIIETIHECLNFKKYTKLEEIINQLFKDNNNEIIDLLNTKYYQDIPIINKITSDIYDELWDDSFKD
jgi:hypothetical protein